MFFEPRERVDIVVAEDALSLEQLNIRHWINLGDNLVEIVEVPTAGLGERGSELLQGSW